MLPNTTVPTTPNDVRLVHNAISTALIAPRSSPSPSSSSRNRREGDWGKTTTKRQREQEEIEEEEDHQDDDYEDNLRDSNRNYVINRRSQKKARSNKGNDNNSRYQNILEEQQR